MNKRPARNETEEDILRMQRQFLEEKAKNPKLQPAAQVVRAPKKSIFSKSRDNGQAEKQPTAAASAAGEPIPTNDVPSEIRENTGCEESSADKPARSADILLGDIVENRFSGPACGSVDTSPLQGMASGFPKVDATPITLLTGTPPNASTSIFAQKMEASRAGNQSVAKIPMETTESGVNIAAYGNSSVMVEDHQVAAGVHTENLQLLSQMKEAEILEERRRLLETIDPALVALLAKRRREKAAAVAAVATPKTDTNQEKPQLPAAMEFDEIGNETNVLPPSNAAVELLERSQAEHWLHFDVVERDKLAWMRNVPEQMAQLKAGEQFEARFDWKGVLLPYDSCKTIADKVAEEQGEPLKVVDERELYLHGEEPHRPGYTLQELFRLARSNVMQQRVSAFGAIAGLLNIYNQGFYDEVLELPVSKLFFLLRFGLDDNTPAMLEMVAKALSYLFYNEADEQLLDFVGDNPACHWQPTLQVPSNGGGLAADDDPTSLGSLQEQMKRIQMNTTSSGPQATPVKIKADVTESEEESRMSMSDFQLAETDLIDCLLRTNILQRIYFILQSVRPDNSTVSSCLKLLIRVARSGRDPAIQIAKNDSLMNCLFENFLPGLERVDTSLQTPPFYNYPQYLCLKLLRVLICQNLGIAVKLLKLQLVEKLQNYLYTQEDMRGKLVKVQIEALRVLRCLFLLRVDAALYKKLLPAFRYLLEWHFNHGIYDATVGGPYLLRQHAAALLAAISAGGGGAGGGNGALHGAADEVASLLGEILHDCCCSWFHRATRTGVKEFSQATLLSAALNAIGWLAQHSDRAAERLCHFVRRYLREFVTSEAFLAFVHTLSPSSLLVRHEAAVDRRNVHAPLPNVGAVLMMPPPNGGPQLIVPQACAVHLLTALWRLMQEQLDRGERTLFETVLQPSVVEPLVAYLRTLSTPSINRYLATNFYAKAELRLICRLLDFDGLIETYFERDELLLIVYNVLCCLGAEHVPQIERLFERVLFNGAYLRSDLDASTLAKWRDNWLALIHPHCIVLSPGELTLSLPHTQQPILALDWPYIHLKLLLQNYLDNVQHSTTDADDFSEAEVLRMTFKFVAQLEACQPLLRIVTPTEQLMYLMIAFMGPDSQFLTADMQALLRERILHFYTQCTAAQHTFDFEATYEGKCKFENLYALFVDHFQAASYGNELFASLLLVPLAQKYDSKWRRRMWSDYVAALRFLDCSEDLLLGGLEAYLEPAETEESLVREYAAALRDNLVRVDTLPHRIAVHHVAAYRCRSLTTKPDKEGTMETDSSMEGATTPMKTE